MFLASRLWQSRSWAHKPHQGCLTATSSTSHPRFRFIMAGLDVKKRPAGCRKRELLHFLACIEMVCCCESRTATPMLPTQRSEFRLILQTNASHPFLAASLRLCRCAVYVGSTLGFETRLLWGPFCNALFFFFSTVGKTSLITRFMYDSFDNTYQVTPAVTVTACIMFTDAYHVTVHLNSWPEYFGLCQICNMKVGSMVVPKRIVHPLMKILLFYTMLFLPWNTKGYFVEQSHWRFPYNKSIWHLTACIFFYPK